MKILAVLAAIVAAAIVVVLILAWRQPDIIRVQRSIAIQAAPERIFPLIEDFHAWREWSPYEAKDPAMERTFGGPERGAGAWYAWKGDSKVGQGRMEIVEAAAPGRVVIKLDFLKPIEGHNQATFTMQPRGDATEVTWAMEGPSPFIGKVMGVLFDMDRMIGRDFETGLANLKARTER